MVESMCELPNVIMVKDPGILRFSRVFSIGESNLKVVRLGCSWLKYSNYISFRNLSYGGT